MLCFSALVNLDSLRYFASVSLCESAERERETDRLKTFPNARIVVEALIYKIYSIFLCRSCGWRWSAAIFPQLKTLLKIYNTIEPFSFACYFYIKIVFSTNSEISGWSATLKWCEQREWLCLLKNIFKQRRVWRVFVTEGFFSFVCLTFLWREWFFSISQYT